MEISAVCSQCGQKLYLTRDAQQVPVEHPDLDQSLGLGPSPGIALPMTFVPELVQECWQWLEAQPCPSCGAHGTLQRTPISSNL
jgi:hypothetical protein